MGLRTGQSMLMLLQCAGHPISGSPPGDGFCAIKKLSKMSTASMWKHVLPQVSEFFMAEPPSLISGQWEGSKKQVNKETEFTQSKGASQVFMENGHLRLCAAGKLVECLGNGIQLQAKLDHLVVPSGLNGPTERGWRDVSATSTEPPSYSGRRGRVGGFFFFSTSS